VPNTNRVKVNDVASLKVPATNQLHVNYVKRMLHGTHGEVRMARSGPGTGMRGVPGLGADLSFHVDLIEYLVHVRDCLRQLLSFLTLRTGFDSTF
jgi:hypothetical protein